MLLVRGAARQGSSSLPLALRMSPRPVPPDPHRHNATTAIPQYQSLLSPRSSALPQCPRQQLLPRCTSHASPARKGTRATSRRWQAGTPVHATQHGARGAIIGPPPPPAYAPENMQFRLLCPFPSLPMSMPRMAPCAEGSSEARSTTAPQPSPNRMHVPVRGA